MTPDVPADWPNVDTSVMFRTPAVRWHVQIAEPDGLLPEAEGAADVPTVLLLHGTGGSTHEWADVIPALRAHARVIAPDLPGHGFSVLGSDGALHYGAAGTTEARDAHVLSLPGMAIAVADLLRSLGRSPDVIAGHSAGAALALRMTLDALVAPKAVIGFNPALIPPPQIWVDVLAPLAGLLVESSWLARSAAWVAGRGGSVRALLESSGARLTDAQVARYAHLFCNPAHCAAALSMMNRWNLPELARDAAGLAVAFTAYVGERDVWVPQAELTSQVTRIPRATLVRVPGVGHLLPEESPETAVNAIRRSLS